MGLKREIVVIVFFLDILLVVAKIALPPEGLSWECSCCWRWQNLYSEEEEEEEDSKLRMIRFKISIR